MGQPDKETIRKQLDTNLATDINPYRLTNFVSKKLKHKKKIPSAKYHDPLQPKCTIPWHTVSLEDD